MAAARWPLEDRWLKIAGPGDAVVDRTFSPPPHPALVRQIREMLEYFDR